MNEIVEEGRSEEKQIECSQDKINNLKANILSSYEELKNNEKEFRKLLKELDLDEKQTFNFLSFDKKIREVIKCISDNQENAGGERNFKEIDAVSKWTNNQISDALKVSEELPRIVRMHKKDLDFELNKCLYEKVQKTIQNVKIERYMTQLENAKKEKVGILGKFTGKQDLKDKKIENISLRLKLAKETNIKPQEKYSVRNMMVDMYIASQTEMDGQFSPEMQELYDNMQKSFKIRSGRGKIEISDEYVKMVAKERLSNEKFWFLMEEERIGFFNKNKWEAEMLQKQNEFLKEKILNQNPKCEIDKYILNKGMQGTSLFSSTLEKIQKMINAKNIQKDREKGEVELSQVQRV